MKVLKEINRVALRSKFENHHDYQYIAFALHKGHCFLVEIDKGHFRRLLLNSSPSDPEPPRAEYPTLEMVLRQIKANPSFLEEKHHGRGLSGIRVKHWVDYYRRHFQQGEPKDCFIIDKFAEMRKEGSFYIIDGMHRLVAFGLWTDLSDEYFPFCIYYCTDQKQAKAGCIG